MTLNENISRNVKRGNGILLLAYNFYNFRPESYEFICAHLIIQQCFLLSTTHWRKKYFCKNFVILSLLEKRRIYLIIKLYKCKINLKTRILKLFNWLINFISIILNQFISYNINFFTNEVYIKKIL